MGRLPVAVPRTIRAADQLRHSGCLADSGQVGDLLLALAAVESHAIAGGPARVPAALVRDLVVITARLAGPAWLEAAGAGTAVITPLQAIWKPPPLPELDRVLAWVLAERFALRGEPPHGDHTAAAGLPAAAGTAAAAGEAEPAKGA